MRIMVLGVRGLPQVQGGVETHAEQLYRRLAQLGCEVEVLVRTPYVPRQRRFYGPVRLRRIWSPRRDGVEALVHSLLGVLYAGFKQPHILHIHAVGPAIVTPLARLLGLRVVVTHHGPDYERDKWGRFARWVLRTGERVGMRHAHARIAISGVVAALVRSKYGCEAHLIPNGVTAAPARLAANLLARFGLESGRYFLQVSRIVPEKRQLDLIRAYSRARLPGWKLVLAGGLAQDAYSKKVVAAARGAQVLLPGYLNGDTLQQLYAHAGAFVLPSSHEGLPIALLEALSHGLPVLASDIPANLEVGLEPASYFPLGNIDALAKGLERLVQSPRSQAARAARRHWVTHAYDWDRVARQTLAVYRDVREAQSVLHPPV